MRRTLSNSSLKGESMSPMRRTLSNSPLKGESMSSIRLMGLMGLLFLLAACSKEAAVEEPVEAAICFGGNLEENAEVVAGTRAETSLAEYGITSFKVWAYKNMIAETQTVMPGFTVNYLGGAHSTNSNAAGWEYVGQQPENGLEQTIKYWDLNAEAYRFFAIAGAYETNEANGTKTFTLGMDGSTPEKAAATPYYSALWFKTKADLESNESYKQPVKLQFYSPFAKVRFIFRFIDPTLTRNSLMDVNFLPSDAITITRENDEITETDIKNNENIAVKGQYTISYPLTGTGTAVTGPTYEVATPGGYLKAFTQDYYETEESSDQLAEYWYYVLPYQASPEINRAKGYTLVATLNGKIKSAVVPEQYMEWKRGYTYTYVFKVTDIDGIAFDEVLVWVNQWNPGGTQNQKVYNW